MKAIFEIEFNPEDMVDMSILQEEYDGSWDKLIACLYELEGLGMFDPDNIKFLRCE